MAEITDQPASTTLQQVNEKVNGERSVPSLSEKLSGLYPV
jgi:hypothetical protein